MPLTLLVSTRLPEEVAAALRTLDPDVVPLAWDADTWPDGADAAGALLTWDATVPEIEQALARAPKVAWIQTHWAGINHLLTPAVVARDVLICNASGAHARPIAEWVLMLMLAFSKRVPELLAKKARRAWEPQGCEEIEARTVGIVGAGQIGREVGRLCRALGMTVLAVRRRVQPTEHVDEVLPLDRLGTMLERSDFVVCTAPLTEATRGLIGPAELARMRPTSYLINVGRGAVVDEAALIDALRERRIAGAGLDVFEVEPLPSDSAFWTLDNVILSPHCCDHTPRTDGRVIEIILDNLRRAVRGEPLRNVVDKHAGY